MGERKGERHLSLMAFGPGAVWGERRSNRMTDDAARTGGGRSPGGAPGDPEALLRAIMRRQARLSVRVASLFLLLVLGLPLVNQYAGPLAQARVAGFSATWLFLGVLFYPITWVLSAYFVCASEAVEQETAAWVGARPRGSAEA